MAYSPSPVAPNIFILKLKLHCTRCENKLKRLLSNVQGIQSVNIDSKKGTITISGTADPTTIVTFLGNLGRKAEILWEQRPSVRDNDQNLQIVTKSNPNAVDRHQFNDPDLVGLLQQLPAGKDVELTYSKTIRLTLKDDKINSGEKNLEITICDGPEISYSGGFCTASASCCGAHGAVNRNLLGNCCCCQIHGMAHQNWTTHGYGFVPPAGPPPPWPGYGPSAPPLGLVYEPPPISSGSVPTPPPAMGYSFSSFLSDDNPAGSCSIM